ncbi:MAG TPA: hypothetical protein VHJ83_00045 [Micromonosporaceae bacterium]|nr:hypothetical protein [Micromonosporaceae bacterium]
MPNHGAGPCLPLEEGAMAYMKLAVGSALGLNKGRMGGRYPWVA